MKISLILVLDQEVGNIERLLMSLSKQTYKNFELIIVSDNKNIECLEKYRKSIDIKLINSNKNNVNNFNVGLIHRTGEILSFPTTNTVYSYTSLEKINEVLSDNENTIVFTNIDKVNVNLSNIDKYTGGGNFFVNIKNQDILMFDTNFNIISIPELLYLYNLIDNGYNTLNIESSVEYEEYILEDKSYIYGAIHKYKKNKFL